MALYEDDSMALRNQGESAPEGFVLKGQMGPAGQEQNYYEKEASPTVGQPQGGLPQGDINQFLDWAVKNKLGFNPLTMNPTTEALKTWNEREADYFNQTFANTGITPSTMTPDALKHWNQQKKEGLAALIQEAGEKQKTGVAYLNMLKQGWEDENTVAGRLELPTGEKALINKFGRRIQNTQAIDTTQRVTATGDALTQIEPTGSMGGKYLTEPAKKEKPTTSAEERKRLVDTTMLMKMTDKVEGLLKEKSAGDWVGPISGRIGQAMEKIEDLPSKQVELYTNIRDMNDFVLRIRSGAQINEQEYKRLTSFLLDPNLPMTNLQSRLKRFKENLKWMNELMSKQLGKEISIEGTKPKSKFKIFRVE
jgi:hypothetical protein